MSTTTRRGAQRASELTPCEHCPKRKVRGRLYATSYTLFVRWHPFKEGWEIRRCVECGKLTAQDSKR